MDKFHGAANDLTVLLAMSALCTVLSLLLRWRLGPSPRVFTGVLSLALVIMMGSAAIIPFVLRTTPGTLASLPVRAKLLFGLGIFVPSLGLVGAMVYRGLRNAGDAYLHHVNADLHRTYDYGKARARERGGDYNGAVMAYRDYFAANPTIPEPLFAAAQLLTHRGRYREAELVLREIRERFEKNTSIWAEATFRLATLLDTDVGDKQGAATLFRELIRRAGDSEQGRLATERLLLSTTAPDKDA
jgi:hypothetical protein